MPGASRSTAMRKVVLMSPWLFLQSSSCREETREPWPRAGSCCFSRSWFTISIAHSVEISDTCIGIVLKLLVVFGISDIFLILISFFCVVGEGGALPEVMLTRLRLAILGFSLPKKDVLTEWLRCLGPLEPELELESEELSLFL